MRFVSFLSRGFITAIVVNPLEMKLAKRTSAHSTDNKWAYICIGTTRSIEIVPRGGPLFLG